MSDYDFTTTTFKETYSCRAAEVKITFMAVTGDCIRETYKDTTEWETGVLVQVSNEFVLVDTGEDAVIYPYKRVVSINMKGVHKEKASWREKRDKRGK